MDAILPATGSVDVRAAKRPAREQWRRKLFDRTRLEYVFDTMLERHPATYFLLLLTCVLALVAIGGFLYHQTSSRSDPYWSAWGSLVSPSIHLKETTRADRLIGLMLTVGGLFYFSLLTSALTANFKQRMEWLRQGAHSAVVEEGHVVVGGINSHLPTVLRMLEKSQLSQLELGSAKSRKQTVVILAEQNTAAIDKTVVPLQKECTNLKLLIRSGSLAKTESFKRVSADRAKSIILLASKEDPYDSDVDAMASITALKPLVEAAPTSVVVEVSRRSTAELLESLGAKVHAVQDLSTKLFAQFTRQPGLFQIYNSLGYFNQIINLRVFPSLAGLPILDARRGFKDAVLLGTIRDGRVEFHPQDLDTLRPDDKLMLLARKGSYRQPPPELERKAAEAAKSGQAPITPAKLGVGGFLPLQSQRTGAPKRRAERILVLGWRPNAHVIIKELDAYVGAGSELVVLADDPVETRQEQTRRKTGEPLRNLTVVHKLGNPRSNIDVYKAIFDKGSKFHREASTSGGRKAFERVPFSVCVISSRSWRAGDEMSDKDTIYSLLLTDLICRKYNVKVQTTTAEVQDMNLAREALAGRPWLSCICANDIMAALAVRVSERNELNKVWVELLNSWGNEFYIKDIKRYVKDLEETPTFAELSERALAWTDLAIGYRRSGTVVLNPCPKDEPLSFGEGDGLVVVSEDW